MIQHMFEPGQSVLAKDYRGKVEKLAQGLIVHRIRHVTYDVDVQSSSRIRHANQLCLSRIPLTKLQDPVHPLDILLDTFEFLQNSLT